MSRIVLILLLGLIACKGKVYRMPSDSMAETIRQGEPFYVKKANAFRPNDLVVFAIYGDNYEAGPDENGNFPKRWEERCYRLMALSGDTLEIKNNVVYINNRMIPFPPGSKLLYHLYSPALIKDPIVDAYLNLAGSPPRPLDKGFVTEVSLSQDQLKTFRGKHPEITKVEAFVPSFNEAEIFYAKPDPALRWNSGNYGPLYIPRPGETIEVTDKNYTLYQHLPGIKKGTYTVTETLYFVMGDNRYFAQDSRFTGFIPHSNMRGIVK